MNCGQCGQPIAAEARFCGQCGSPVVEPDADEIVGEMGADLGAEEPTIAPPEPPPAAPAPPPPTAAIPPPPPQPVAVAAPAPPTAAVPYPYPPAYAAPAPQSTNGFAIASLVLGILWLYWIGSILALIFGYVGKNQIDNSGGRQGGRGLAIAGIVLGWIGVAVLLLLIVVGVGVGFS